MQNILVCDDDKQIVEAIDIYLTGEGYHVIKAYDGYEALKILDSTPVDLMIRTSGEQRLSNFLLWQCAYAEFYFTPTLFPDFDKAAFDEALAEYARRDRRMGG